jgi:hypothetical protein
MRIAPLFALLLIVAFAPLLGACETDREVNKVVAAIAAENAECAAKGGHFERTGKAQIRTCIAPYSDAGKACTDGAQCLGKRCMGDFEDAHAANPATGTCVATNNPFGCQTIIDADVARTICVD